MEYTELLNKRERCCGNGSKGFAFNNGEIKHLSSELKNCLGNFDVYAERFTELLNQPVFKKYPDFKLMLDHFSKSECKGCRNDDCKLLQDCNVKQCSKDHSVDFCFQCTEFPCKKHGFDKHLENRWININNKMKKIGVEGYYKEIENLSRY